MAVLGIFPYFFSPMNYRGGTKKERPLCYTHLGGTPMPEKVMQTENAHMERPC